MNAVRQPEIIWACEDANCHKLLLEIICSIKQLKSEIKEINNKLDMILSK